jgi:uncharacterized cupin superfamily protein
MSQLKTVHTPEEPLPSMPINADWIKGGDPNARGTILLQSDDQLLSSGFWECSPGQFEWNFEWDEFARVIEGEVTVREENGDTYTLGPGDVVHFPLGLKTHWDVKKTMKKVFFIRTTEPLQL